MLAVQAQHIISMNNIFDYTSLYGILIVIRFQVRFIGMINLMDFNPLMMTCIKTADAPLEITLLHSSIKMSGLHVDTLNHHKF